jgi:putative acyl-CoA dehydrogenase
MEFFQTPPTFGHPFLDDSLLRSYLGRLLPKEVLAFVEKDLTRFGERVRDELEVLANEAEREHPVHVPYDPWGKRIDHVKVSRAWERLHEIAAEEGIVALGYERPYAEFSRLYQFAKLYLYHPSSAIYSCPLAMTDGAARVIELFGSQEMKERAFVHLTSRDPKKFWTSGQWMTERTGGSDVSGTSTIAKIKGDHFELHGVKWFTSATTSEMAMTLARIEGEEKLSLFYVELRDKNGDLQNIQINRLKDKLGTKALPTAELTLLGTPAVLVGERGKGVKTIANLFNITRVYNAVCAVGYMRRGIALALDYAKKRKAFGQTIIQHGSHAEILASLQVRFEASFLLTFHTAYLLGKEETKKTDEIESGTLRLLIPLAKLFTAKEGVQIASEVLEAFGGAGYVEDTNLPALLRNAQVLAIWEGTTNVLSLDALRAIAKERAGEAFVQDVQRRMKVLNAPELNLQKEKILRALEVITKQLDPADYSEAVLTRRARTLAYNLARTYCASLLIEEAASQLKAGEKRGEIVLNRWLESGLVEELLPENASETEKILKGSGA